MQVIHENLGLLKPAYLSRLTGWNSKAELYRAINLILICSRFYIWRANLYISALLTQYLFLSTYVNEEKGDVEIYDA